MFSGVNARRKSGWWIAACVFVSATAGCSNGRGLVLTRLMDARRLAADLRVQFSKAADAANRAVMADTDEASHAAAREAGDAKQVLQRDVDTLQSILQELSYSDESRLLDEFRKQFAEYEIEDRPILELAVENTNLKAQRLAFGPAHEAAQAFRTALETVARSASSRDACCVGAVVAEAIAAVQEIQVLQSPHIAESDQAAMTRLETRMAASEATARKALDSLKGMVRPASGPQLTAAVTALDRFKSINTELIALSRRNSNVRSLALSLGRKRTLTAACDDTLQALRDALEKRGFNATR